MARSSGFTGRSHSPETRARMSAARKGNQNALGLRHTADTKSKMSADRLGRTHTPEAREKISSALRGRVLSPEWRAKLSARMIGNTIVRDAVVIGLCAYCDGPATGTDHVIPLSRGGTDTDDNRVPCCASCNSSKNNRTPEEWLAGVKRETSGATLP